LRAPRERTLPPSARLGTLVKQSRNSSEAVPLRSTSFEQLVGVCAVLAGVAAFLYTVAFDILQNDLLSGLFLMLTGLLSTAALVAVYERLSETDAIFALLRRLGIGGALGSAVRGGYDLANVVNPPPSVPDLPNPVDTRGLLTFGVAGIALFIVAWLLLAVGSSRRV
jgi:drug/metabolite transporter (DMT)-like permease